ncbi:MAG: PorT family protein [Bryobacterales bacterium]|nr:PorT family protein [Bryobacterales bacterium]
MSRIACLMVLSGALAACFGQQVGFGVKAGGRVSDDLASYWASSESKRYVVGPMVDVRLALRFGVEVDALYRRVGFRTFNGGFWGSNQDNYRANSWEFPMLLKYRLPILALKPYAVVGYAPRYISGHYRAAGESIDILTGASTPYTRSGDWKPDVSHGVVAGGGVEFGGRHVRIAPEVRYTRWFNDPINFYGSRGYSVSAAQNQVEVLVGIFWRR